MHELNIRIYHILNILARSSITYLEVPEVLDFHPGDKKIVYSPVALGVGVVAVASVFLAVLQEAKLYVAELHVAQSHV